MNSLRLSDSDLHADRPFIGETDKMARFTRQVIRVQWRMGDPIDLYVIKPAGVAKPPVVLYLYSYPSETDRFKDDGYCDRITSGGFAAVGFVSALTGHRYHDVPMRKWFVSELQDSLVLTVHDVQMILNYLSTRGDLDTRRVGMFGAGSGGTIAILSASMDSRIKAIDLLDPWGDWPKWMESSELIPDSERPNYVKAGFLSKIAPFDPVYVLPKLRNCAIRLQQVSGDPNTPDACQKRIATAAGRSAKVIRYDDTVALFRASSGGRLFEWIKEQVAPQRHHPHSGGKRS